LLAALVVPGTPRRCDAPALGSIARSSGLETGEMEGAQQERSGSAPPRAVHCRICTIFIGEGYQETRPIPLPDGKGYVCWRCYESVRRQAARRSAGPSR
jgi:hypothetical protein